MPKKVEPIKQTKMGRPKLDATILKDFHIDQAAVLRYKEDKAMRSQERRERHAYLKQRGRLPSTIDEDSDSSDLREKLREYREHENVILD